MQNSVIARSIVQSKVLVLQLNNLDFSIRVTWYQTFHNNLKSRQGKSLNPVVQSGLKSPKFFLLSIQNSTKATSSK